MVKEVLSNTDKIYAEHPFLEKIRPRVKVKSAEVKRWNEEFFATSAIYGSFTPLVRLAYKFVLLDAQGAVVTHVGESRIPFWTRDENAAQALARIKHRAKRVRYAVLVDDGYGKLTLFKR